MKKSLGVAAAVLALASMGAAPTTSVQATQASHVNEIITPPSQPKSYARQNPRLPFVGQSIKRSGLTPKEYGQMLQARGLQKWVKSKKHRK